MPWRRIVRCCWRQGSMATCRSRLTFAVCRTRFDSSAWRAYARRTMDRQPRILVVDDLPANIKVLDAILVARGYEVLPAGSGPEALERVAVDRPDLVLLDIDMPGMDGHEVCERIRRFPDPMVAMLPVIMITAMGAEQKVRAVEAGADDFITKPI